MNAQIKTPELQAAESLGAMPDQALPNAAASAPTLLRFDRKFIDDHQLLERYMGSQLPVKGARDFEAWCRTHPEFLEEHKLAERAQASLKLLEASGRSMDLGEPTEPWWRNLYLHAGVAVVALLSLIAFMSLFGKYTLLRGELDDAKLSAKRGSLLAPSAINTIRIEPDRAPGMGSASVSVNPASATLVALRINMSFTKLPVFRVTVEKREQGRALVIDGLAKDSNGELKVDFNSSGLAPGQYDVRIDGLPFRGQPIGMGWLVLNVR